MSFRLVPKSVTLNDFERRHGRYIALFHWIWPTRNRRVDLWRNFRHRSTRPWRRSKSFKVTDFDINRKLIYDFLLVIILTSYLAPFPRNGW